ncbi:hypothetical protein B0T14DRAFT_596129 [Immersiella caudata]|uniref:2EXR domain-containing protein n=1 Tax=Immersiella caudata TaxID=314043 RepID=A0AA39TQK3_9PEZI|nr:hypothetical protein B0T14DRAFT_596129 [Immersiella caudata]
MADTILLRTRAIPKPAASSIKKPRKKQDPVKAAEKFQLAKLPLELREKIWEQSIKLTHHALPKHNGVAFPLPDQDNYTYYSYAAPALASVCRESRAVVKRLQRQGDKDAFELRKIPVGALNGFGARMGRALQLEPVATGSDYPLVFDLPAILALSGHALSLATGPLKHGDAMINLLLAAKDNQIKIVSHIRQHFYLPDGASQSLANGRQWVARSRFEAPRLASVHDMVAWRELKSIATASDLPWAVADTILDVESPGRKDLIDRALRPLEDLWKRHDARLRRAGKEGAKPLPKIDVVVVVEIYKKQHNPYYRRHGEFNFDYEEELHYGFAAR